MRNKGEQPSANISDEQRRILMERLLASACFSRSPRLSAFLSYICEQDRLGQAHLINEQRIGVAVFGRPVGYNVGDDSIVRSQARFLRQRLEEYFTHEGEKEPFVLFIPKGSYLPLFQSRKQLLNKTQSLPTSRDSAFPLSWAEALRRSSRRSRFLWGSVGICLTLFVALALHNGPTHLLSSAGTINEERFWKSLFDARRTPILVPSDSSLVLLQKLGNRSIPLQDYMNRRYITAPPSPELEGIWHNLSASQYTSVADLNLTFRLEQLPVAAKSHLSIRYARSLALNELKENNAVLIGSRRSNPWVELFMPSMRTDVGYDMERHENFVWNRNPSTGEQERYYETTSDTQHVAYGFIAHLASLDGRGVALLVGGTSKAGTEAASEFLLSKSFTNFLSQFDTQKPLPHFEILLSTENINGEADAGKIVYFHILN